MGTAIKTETKFQIKRGLLRVLATCACREGEDRPALCTIHVQREGDELILVSTNGNIGAIATIDKHDIRGIADAMEMGISFPASLIPNSGNNNHEFFVEINHGEKETLLLMHGPTAANPNLITAKIKPESEWRNPDIAWRGLFLTDIPERVSSPEICPHFGLSQRTVQELAKVSRLLKSNLQFFTDGSGKNVMLVRVGVERNLDLTVMPSRVDFIYRRAVAERIT